MTVESTCNKDKCMLMTLSKTLGIEGECPAEITTVWTSEESSQPKTLNDCAFKRMVFMQMDDHSISSGVRINTGEMRSTIERLDKESRNFMIESRQKLEHLKCQAALQAERTGKLLLEAEKKIQKTDEIEKRDD